MNKTSYTIALGILLFISSLSVHAVYSMSSISAQYVPYLSELQNANDFNILKGKPLTTAYSQIDAIKMVYDLQNKKLYFINASLYAYHYEFCYEYLTYKKSLEEFNLYEYSNDARRVYLLANLNYYKSIDKYGIEFFSDDKINDTQIAILYNAVCNAVYFKDKVYVVANGFAMSQTDKIPTNKILKVNEIYDGQIYQPMVYEVSYGILKHVNEEAYNIASYSSNDILIYNFLPNDIPYCRGIITTQFQTPLAHVNLLANHRHIPNCAYKYALSDSNILALIGKAVRMEVTDNNVLLTALSPKDSIAFINKPKQNILHKLTCNVIENKIVSANSIRHFQSNAYGGKAANFGELYYILRNNISYIPLPEAAYAIPFYYYKKHLENSGLDRLVDSIIQSEYINADRALLDYHLKILRMQIMQAPIDSLWLKALYTELQLYPEYTCFRFRSSTNAEDIDGFNGAGIYLSKSGCIKSDKKNIEVAIKSVWASLWNLRAYEERKYAEIDQHSVAMGILIHRAFGDEEANGVAITKNIYNPEYPAFTINIQPGEYSVVLPKENMTPEQFLIKKSSTRTHPDAISVEHIAFAPLHQYQPILHENEIKELYQYLAAIKWHFYYVLKKQYTSIGFDEFAMDIEFKLEAGSRKIYIKQARLF